MRKPFVLLILGCGLGVAVALAAPARPASAHPLGNFSVNQLAALELYPDRVETAVVVDLAELPTLQEKSTVDAGYAGRTCAAFARDFEVSVGEQRLMWTVRDPAFEYAPGAAGLSTSRLTCRLVGAAPLGTPATVTVVNRYRADRVGWQEMTAVGHGVRLVDSPLPAHSVSGDLRSYPPDLLSSPLDVRSARLRVEPGEGGPAGAPGVAPPGRGPVLTRWTAAAEQVLRDMVGGRRLTPLVGVLALLLALSLGAAHAALPGHGKTVMAAYLAGRRGRPRDALAVGATVTLTHTGGVLLLGLLLTVSAGFAGETVLGWLGVVSGVLVAVVGAAMLARSVRRTRGSQDQHDHHHHHHRHHSHEHEHGPEHGHGHGHEDHHHHHRDRPSRLSIVGMGVAGGLVPSPSALVILLGAVGLGRTGFGILLILGYGLGMAATLTAAGLLLIRLRDRLASRAGTVGRLSRLVARLSTVAPQATAGLVVLVGLGLAGRALAALA
jgi:ABC-type nickel/cobalt efflux system permease component RcnA